VPGLQDVCRAVMIRAPRGTDCATVLAVGLVAGFLTGILFQGSRGIYDTTEGRYCLVSREMQESGRWLEPTLLGLPHWTKPPLTYWTIAASVRLFGRNAWAARLPNVIFLAVSAAAAGAIALRLWGRAAGIWAALIYAGSVYPVAVANTVNTDTLLTMWELLALWSFVAFLAGCRKCRYSFWAALGMGFLTKGPPALVPLLAAGTFLIARRRGRALRDLVTAGAVALFAVISLWWYAWALWRHPGLLEYFVKHEILGRLAENEFHRNPEWYAPLVVYGPCLLLGAGFWSGWLVPAARRWGWLRPRKLKDVLRRSDAALFLLSWFLPGLLVFSLSSSRMYDYVLPLFGAVALVIARIVSLQWPGADHLLKRRILLAGLASALLAVAAKTAPLLTEPYRDMGSLYAMVQPLEKQADAIVLYRERICYGLGFYARKPVFRCHHLPEDRPPIRDCGCLVDQLLVDPQVHRVVFVCTLDRRGELQGFLAARGIRIQQEDRTHRWYAVAAAL